MDGAALLAALGGSAAAAKRNPKEEEEAKVSSLSGAEEWVQFNGILDSFPLRGPEVNVVPHSSGDHDRGSSKLKLKNLVNFGWQHSYHHGQLLTTPPPASPMAQLLAYAIVTPGKREGVVRVAHRKTGERTLLKGMTGKVKDLAFASIAGSEVSQKHISPFLPTASAYYDLYSRASWAALTRSAISSSSPSGRTRTTTLSRRTWCCR